MALHDLANKIQETAAALRRSRDLLAQNPEDFLLTLDVASLEKRQADLQEAFAEAARESGINVLQYRLFKEQESPILIRAVASALGTFQTAYSVLFDAVKGGTAKARARLSLEVQEQSSFAFGYAFLGSVGFALTMPREYLLLGDDSYDRTIAALVRTTRVSGPEELKEIAHSYGIATVRAMYKWADTLANNGLGTELDWQLSGVRHSALLQRPELAHFRNIIGLTSDVETTVKHLRGTLFAIDTKRRTFGLGLPDGDSFRGTLSESINHEVRVPAEFNFELQTSRTTRYSTEEEEIKYTLLSIY